MSTSTPKILLTLSCDSPQLSSKTFHLSKSLTILSIHCTKQNALSYTQNPLQYNCPLTLSRPLLLIGRQHNNHQLGNWIKMTDGSVSRNHCIIEYKPEEMGANSHVYRAWMSCCSDSLVKEEGEKSKKRRRVVLPKVIGKKVIEFLVSPEKYVIRDCRSKFGTKIKLSKPMKIGKQDVFVFGEEIEMKILGITVKDVDSVKQSVLLFEIKVGNENPVEHSIVTRKDPYKIGVNQEISIEDTASLDFLHPQCLVYEKKEEWWVVDGDGVTGSSYGTYKKVREEEEFELEWGMEMLLGGRAVLKWDLQEQK